jgi:hypothetical protein
MTKQCKKCGVVKLPEDFYTTGRPKVDGTPQRQGTCKVCMTEILREWRLNNPIAYRNQHTRSGTKRTQRIKRDVAYQEKQRQYKRDNSKKNFISSMWSRAKGRAKKLNLEFTLQVSDIIVPKYCPLLGVELKCGNKNSYQASPSLDRLDPTQGYTATNARVISTLANTMKNGATKDQLLMFSKNLPAYLANMR